ncbi:hypothetical protein [Mycobacterium asiaticum]|uniref:VG15 protein n=1 Tax=Mycobacterium asiaticum TaxID=1790 RepID=UPI0007EFEE0F|nr:hypothetical protein [Mycobacterium asiaticum]OBJ60250.1 hypothetical protein A9W94_13880 [Mycobacterium asiaticum]
MTQPQSAQQPTVLLYGRAPIYSAWQLRQAQDTALRPLLTRVRKTFQLQGVPVTAEQRATMVDYLWRPMSNARQRTYEASARYLQGQGFTQAPPLREYRPEAVDAMLENTVERVLVAGDPVTEENRTTPHVVEQARKSVARAASRHAQQPARETVKEAADDSGQEIGWARVLVGAKSCHFCAMLASRGPVYKSDKTALYRGGATADTYHDGCDCIAVLVRRGVPWEGEDSYRKLAALWEDTGGKESGKKARNSFRRAWDKTVRDGGSGDYIADAMKPPGGA